MTITEWCDAAWANAEAHGFSEKDIPAKLMLIVCEAAEAMEDYRKQNMEHFPEEIADICIRVFSLCGYHKIDLEAAIEKKHAFNITRPYKHGGKIV